MNKRKLSAILAVLLSIILASVILWDVFRKEPAAELSGVAMGSVVSVKLYGKDGGQTAETIINAALQKENEGISRYKSTSEIYRLNENGKSDLSPETANILNRCIRFSDDTDGAFDVTVGKLSSLWNFDGDSHIIPAEQDIASALKSVGSEKITQNGNQFTLGDGQCVDLGAVGKGLACDDAKAILDKSDISGGVVSVGGSVLVYGKNPNGNAWTVGVRTPENGETSNALKISITGTKFISTSGNYEKCFTENGKLYHHILSPQTGYPANSDLKSVTVIADSGLDADALSTACFVLGKEKAKPLLEAYNACGLFIEQNNTVYISGAIFENCEALSDDYTLYIL